MRHLLLTLDNGLQSQSSIQGCCLFHKSPALESWPQIAIDRQSRSAKSRCAGAYLTAPRSRPPSPWGHAAALRMCRPSAPHRIAWWAPLASPGMCQADGMQHDVCAAAAVMVPRPRHCDVLHQSDKVHYAAGIAWCRAGFKQPAAAHNGQCPLAVASRCCQSVCNCCCSGACADGSAASGASDAPGTVADEVLFSTPADTLPNGGGELVFAGIGGSRPVPPSSEDFSPTASPTL